MVLIPHTHAQFFWPYLLKKYSKVCYTKLNFKISSDLRETVFEDYYARDIDDEGSLCSHVQMEFFRTPSLSFSSFLGWKFAEIWPIIRKGNVYQAQKVVERVCVFFLVCLFLFSLFLSVASIRFSVFLFAIFFFVRRKATSTKTLKKNQTNKQKNNEYNHSQLKRNRKKNNNNGKNKRNINQNKVRSDSRNYFW